MSKARQSTGDAKRIDASMNVMEIIAMHPDAADVLAEYGLHCFRCAFNTMDSLDTGARAHGLGDDDIDNMIDDLEELLTKEPARRPVLTLTDAAASALLHVAESEGKQECLLKVMSDGHGGFCMEFADASDAEDKRFRSPTIENVYLIASDAALARIGGATVDFREERFKLDVVQPAACGCGGSCSCGA